MSSNFTQVQNASIIRNRESVRWTDWLCLLCTGLQSAFQALPISTSYLFSCFSKCPQTESLPDMRQASLSFLYPSSLFLDLAQFLKCWGTERVRELKSLFGPLINIVFMGKPHILSPLYLSFLLSKIMGFEFRPWSFPGWTWAYVEVEQSKVVKKPKE